MWEQHHTCCRAHDTDNTRPGADAPFVCPLTGEPLNGRSKVFLHRPTGLLLSERGLKSVPQLAREMVLEAAQAALAPARDGSSAAAAASDGTAKRALAAVVAAGGAWQEKDLMVINPEGQDAEDAKDRVTFLSQKVRSTQAPVV